MNKKKTAPIVMTALVVLTLTLAAFAMPVSASGNPGAGCPSETKYQDTIRGGVYFEYDTSNPDKPKTMVFNNVPDGIKFAKVYFGIWQGSPGKGGNFTIDIVSGAGTYNSPVYRSCDPCPGGPCGIYPNAYQNDDTRCNHLFWEGNPPGTPPHNKPPNVPSDNIRGYITGCGVQFISFDATPYIASGTNTVTVTPELCSAGCPCYNSNWDRRVYTIALLVVYEDDDMSEITYWINEGAPYMEENSGCDGPLDHPDASFWLNGTSMIANPTGATYEVLGWPHVASACGAPRYTKLNSNDIGCPDYTGYAGGWDVYVRYDNVLDDTTLQNNNFMDYHAPGAYYMRGNVAVLVASSGGKDLTVTDIEFPEVMKPNTGYTIGATITNLGGDPTGPFHVSLLVDDSPYGAQVSVPGGLPGGGSTPVFFPVNLASGCYKFTVVADCNGVVAESNENNNETSEYYQVGNVIVVENNADLIAEADRVEGGTYYIEDRTITNCAGDGITIKNTNLPFVISNCVVHDCGGNAVYMYNVVNGGVKDSTLEDNNPSGIRLEKCRYVDIDNNTLQNNVIYGIDVYMETMPTVDCDNIHITGNTVTGNQYGLEVLCDDCIVCSNNITSNTHLDYAMYLAGNDNKIYNNTIEDNAGYGLKLLQDIPSSGNEIYWNDFINNKGGATPQAYDSGATNTWNTATTVSYPYGCSIYTNYNGNYWDDYTGSGNGQGIGTTPYIIAGGPATDNFPLMVKWRLCGDVNRNGAVNMGDVVAVRNNYVTGLILCNSWAADVNCNGAVNMGDVVAVRNHYVTGLLLNCCKDC